MPVFGIILISACTLIHIYVFWRAASVPIVARRVPGNFVVGAGASLWAIFFSARVFGHGGTGPLAGTIELVGMNWMGALFLFFVCLFAVDFVTLFGFLIPRRAPSLRGWALAAGGSIPPLILQISSDNMASTPSVLN
jgi:hypothetical protein